MIPYTYLIKCIPENVYYYGVKYSKDADPETFWKKYFTSSEYVHRLIDKYGVNAFEYEIRRVFHSVSEARKWEQHVLKRIKAVERSDFLNMNVPPDNFGFASGNDNPSNSPIGRKRNSETTQRRLHDGSHPFLTLEHSKSASKRAKNRNAQMNKIRNAKYGRMIVECPHCGKVGGQSGMRINHFNNCKRKELNRASMGKQGPG